MPVDPVCNLSRWMTLITPSGAPAEEKAGHTVIPIIMKSLFNRKTDDKECDHTG